MHRFKVIFLLVATVGAGKCCTNDEECTVSGTTCNDGECICEKGYLLSAEANQCLPYVTEYYGDCSEDAQCEWLGPNSFCKYVCRCQEGYRWYLGQCQKYVGLGDTCTENTDCFDGYNLQSLTCNETCSCAEGYYNRDETDCRKIASNVGDICALDIDCQVPDTDTICHVGKCQVPSNLEEEFLGKVEETVSYNTFDAIACTNDEDCSSISNSYCYNQTDTCICKAQYFFNSDGTTCIPELGVDIGCTNNSDCVLKPGKCDNGACYCRDYYVAADGNRKCIKTMTENNWNCLSSEWCSPLGRYSYCASSGTCNCSKVSEYDTNNTLCIWNGENDPDMCFNDVDCKYIYNGFCVDEACGCKSGNVLQDNRCVPNIGSPCSDEVRCEIANSQCLDNVCQCQSQYISFENKCYLKQYHLNDTCATDNQCSISYAKCVDTKCGCDEKHLPFNNTCYEKREFGSYCNNRLECLLSLENTMGDTVFCRNHICQCATGYTLADNRCSSGVWSTGNFLMISSVMLLKGVFSVS